MSGEYGPHTTGSIISLGHHTLHMLVHRYPITWLNPPPSSIPARQVIQQGCLHQQRKEWNKYMVENINPLSVSVSSPRPPDLGS